MLREKQAAGVEVTVVTWTPDAYGYGDAAFWMRLHEDMRQEGFYIKTVEDSCEHFAVIDQELVWYGNMNLLAREKMEDSMMRVKGKEIAAELLELTFKLAMPQQFGYTETNDRMNSSADAEEKSKR